MKGFLAIFADFSVFPEVAPQAYSLTVHLSTSKQCFSRISTSAYESHMIHRAVFPLKIMKQNAQTKDRHVPLL